MYIEMNEKWQWQPRDAWRRGVVVGGIKKMSINIFSNLISHYDFF